MSWHKWQPPFEPAPFVSLSNAPEELRGATDLPRLPALMLSVSEGDLSQGSDGHMGLVEKEGLRKACWGLLF